MSLPQFDTSFFQSQIFWCFFSFLILWASFHFWVVPRFFDIRHIRQNLIEDTLKKAHSLENQTAALLSQSKLVIDLAHKEARALILEAKNHYQKEYALFCEMSNKKYEEKLREFQNDLMIQEKEVLKNAFQEKDKYVQDFFNHFIFLDSHNIKKASANSQTEKKDA